MISGFVITYVHVLFYIILVLILIILTCVRLRL